MGKEFSKEALALYAAEKRNEFERVLSEIVEIPSVSV